MHPYNPGNCADRPGPVVKRCQLITLFLTLGLLAALAPAARAAAPANDDFNAPDALGSLPSTRFLDNTQATVQLGEPIDGCGGVTVTGTLWYRVTGTGTAVTVLARPDGASDWNSVIAIYRRISGSPPRTSERLVCVHGSGTTFKSAAGAEYLVQVGSPVCWYDDVICARLNDLRGSGRIEVLKAPPNDDRAAATAVQAGADYAVDDTRSATTEGGEVLTCTVPGTGGTGFRNTVWFRYTAPRVGMATFTASGPDSPVLAVYRADETNPIACAKASQHGGLSRLTLPVAPGDYLIQIGAAGFTGGSHSFRTEFVPELDTDRDGHPVPGDCNDADSAIHPGVDDVPDNGVDEDCDGDDAVNLDRDGDGHRRPVDCADTEPSVNPAARDIPRSGIDEDCDGDDADYPRIQADIRHAEKGRGRRTVVRRLTVTGLPKDARIRLSCRGKGCRFHARTVRPAAGVGGMSLLKQLRGMRLARGAVLDVAVTAPATYGRLLRLTIRDRKSPRSTWLKIDPVTRKVSPW